MAVEAAAEVVQNGRMRSSEGAGDAGEPIRRASGIGVLAAIVVVGLAVPTYYLWAVPRLKQEADRLRVEAPDEPAERLGVWFHFGQPQIHTALVRARFSADRPWYVSHVVQGREDEAPVIYGIDFTDLPVDVVQHEGLEVRVVLPAPTLLARDVLVGDKAFGVPVYAQAAAVPDGRVIAKERLERYFADMAAALGKDIPGARLVVEIGGLR